MTRTFLTRLTAFALICGIAAVYGRSCWSRFKKLERLASGLEQRYRPQIEHLEAYRPMEGRRSLSRQEELELFSAPEILDAGIETQTQPGILVYHAIKSAAFSSFRDQRTLSVDHGYGTLPSGESVKFITYVGRTRHGGLPFRIRFDIGRLALQSSE